LEGLIKDGMGCRFKKDANKTERLKELQGMTARRNHKSAEEGSEKATKLLAKDAAQGFSIPASPETVDKIQGEMVQPLGQPLGQPWGWPRPVQTDQGRARKVKHWLTQDLSFSLMEEEMSVNSRIDVQQHPEMFCGWCISRVIHFIVSLRLALPTKRTFILKHDHSDACQRMAHPAKAAAQSIAVLLAVACMAIRLTLVAGQGWTSWGCGVQQLSQKLGQGLQSKRGQGGQGGQRSILVGIGDVGWRNVPSTFLCRR
jgi:hypothetical protein